MRRHFVGWVLGLWIVLACSLTSPARAQVPTPVAGTSAGDVDRAKESFRVGAAAYSAGEYQAAISALDSAYALAPLPAIAFSLAQAERRQYFVDRQLEHLVRSVALFRRYLEQVPSGGRRADALDALAQLEPLVARREAAPPEATARPASTRLLVIAEASGARVWIDDDELVGAMIREVTPGEHRVVVRAPGYHDAERTVMAVAGELIPVSMVLGELPGMLEVRAPTAAEIYIDGAFASLGGNVSLQVASGKHRISVSQNGHRMTTREVDMPRGGRQQVHLELEPTGQRMTSHVLLIGGAVALGTGTFLSVLAVQTEGAARDFLARRDSANVSTAELVRYQADVERRDRYRMMAGVNFAASLGLLVTGLFLHELDQPRVEELNRNVELEADIGPGQLGARLQGAF
jgi:hypothetical protein